MAMATACAEKEKAATEAIAAANERITHAEARIASVYESAMATMTPTQRADLVASETDPEAKARASEIARKMDEEDEKKAKKYPVKVREKVSSESAREAALERRIAELEASPAAASMRAFRASLGLDLGQFDRDIAMMSPDQVTAAYNLESHLYNALQAASSPPPGMMIAPGQSPPIPGLDMAPPGTQGLVPATLANVGGTPSPQYAASSPQEEFRL